MSETVRILKEARELISDPAHWTREVFSGRNAAGDECFCAVGALNRVAGVDYGALSDAKGIVRRGLPDQFPSITDFNDAHDHHAVLSLFDKAIAEASA